MNKAVVLHTVSDAKHCVDNKLYEGRLLFSTHSSVDVYLKEEHNLDCRCLSRFMSTEELINQRDRYSAEVDDLLRDLDDKLSPILNNKFGLKLNYFVPLYSYFGKLHFLTYVYFVNFIKETLKSLKVDKVYFYDFRFNIFLNTKTDMRDVVNCLFGDLETDIIKFHDNGNRLKTLLKGIISGVKVRLRGRDFSNNNFCGKKRTIVLATPLYELQFLKRYLKKYNVFNPPVEDKYTPSGLEPDFINANFIKDTDSPLVKLFLKDINEDLLGNIGKYLKIVNSVKDINKRYGIRLGIWGIPPSWKARSLIYEYLRSENIKIIGSQHGCLYGETFSPHVFEIDFNRCNYYLSWGFTKEDLKRIYPTRQIDVEILPFGKVNFIRPKKKAKIIDILFPITLSISAFEDGMTRIPPHELTERQVALLGYLGSLKGVEVYLKPFPYSNQENCSTFCLFKRLKNIRVANDITLSKFLASHSPRAVLIDFPSQPLFDVIHLDTEIFLMGDRSVPYEKRALEELKRRVHYSENVDETISKLELFLNGKLEKKRDDTFYNHYVHKEDTERKILELVEELAGS